MTPQDYNPITLTPLEDRWLNAKEAARYIGVEVETLSKWRSIGKSPPYSATLPRDPRYKLSDLIKFMSAKMATNTRQARTLREKVN